MVQILSMKCLQDKQNIFSEEMYYYCNNRDILKWSMMGTDVENDYIHSAIFQWTSTSGKWEIYHCLHFEKVNNRRVEYKGMWSTQIFGSIASK